MQKQEDFQNIFDNLINDEKVIVDKKCYINVPLEGEINLSTLKNKNIEEIHFPEGKISRILNIPVGIKKIIINNNALEELPVQRDLVYLEANNNNLTKANLKEMVSLVSLFLNNNQIEKIENLPASLETLHADQNKLVELDLTHAPKCKNVSCKNNPNLYQIIGGKQISSPDFNLNKDAQTQIRLDSVSPKSHNSTKEDVLYPDVKEAVNEYYQLKRRYEESKKDVINRIMLDNKGSRKSKIKKVRNAVFKCINCGRDGGTIFAKENMNFLTAVCGNTTHPCKLNITIISSMYMGYLDSELEELKNETEQAKQKIIQTKMNTIFGYIDEIDSIAIFNTNLEKIKSNTINSALYDESSYYEMQTDSKKTHLVSKKMADVYEKLAEIRRNMDEYSKTGNKQILEAVAQKQKQIYDTLNVVRSIKYPIHEMVKETVYNLVDDEGNFIDESKAPQMDLNVLKQYPYNFDDRFNKFQEFLSVKKYVTNVNAPLTPPPSTWSSMDKYFVASPLSYPSSTLEPPSTWSSMDDYFDASTVASPPSSALLSMDKYIDLSSSSSSAKAAATPVSPHASPHSSAPASSMDKYFNASSSSSAKAPAAPPASPASALSSMDKTA